MGGTILFGSITLKDNVYVASAILKNQIELGINSFVGMGSVVVKDVPDGATVYGVPARERDE